MYNSKHPHLHWVESTLIYSMRHILTILLYTQILHTHILYMDILTLGRLYYVIQCIDDLVITEIDSYAEHIYYIMGLYTILM